MNKSGEIMHLIQQHFWEMSEDTSLNLGNEPVLPEDAEAFFVEFFQRFAVDAENFDFSRYFPNPGIRFLPNCILPDYLKTQHQPAQNLTVKMIVASGLAGKWLY